MARLYTSGFELNSVGISGTVEWTSANSGSLGTIQSTIARNGNYAPRFTGFSSTTRQLMYYQFSSISSKVIYIRGYIYFTTFPGVTISVFAASTSSSSGSEVGFQITNAGLLQGYKTQGGVATVGAGTTLSTGIWYRLEATIDNTGAGGAHIATFLVDGVSIGSSSTLTLNTATGYLFFNIGRFNAGSADTAGDWYLDDLAVNDNSGSFQNTYPGAGSVIHLRPNGAGSSTQWTPDAGSNWYRVSEITPDSATSLVSSVTNGQTDWYTLDNLVIDASSVAVVHVGGEFNNNTADATTAFKFQLEKTASGTVSQSAAIIPNTTNWNINAIAVPDNYPITLYQDPDSINWTTDTLNSMQIGVTITAAGANKIQLSTIWAVVEYTPLPQNRPGNYGKYVTVGNGMSRNEGAS